MLCLCTFDLESRCCLNGKSLLYLCTAKTLSKFREENITLGEKLKLKPSQQEVFQLKFAGAA